MQRPTVSRPGPERIVLAAALLLPLGLMAVALAQLLGVTLASPAGAASGPLLTHRPASSAGAPPPTLAAPMSTPVPPTLAPTAVVPRTYTVQAGDELKHIAASYGVSIWSIIDANDIPDPDSLRVGQVLQIPSN
jgi:LysM repeat protein